MTETWCFACYGAGYIKVSDINIVCPTCVGQGTLTKGEKQMSEEETTVTSVVLDGPLDAVQKEIERLKLDIEAEKVHASNYRQELFKLKEIVHNFFAEQFSDNEDEITVHRDEANELLGDIGADLLKQEFEESYYQPYPVVQPVSQMKFDSYDKLQSGAYGKPAPKQG